MGTATVAPAKAAPAEARAATAMVALGRAVPAGTREVVAMAARAKEETAVAREETATVVPARVARAVARAVMAMEVPARVDRVGTKAGMETEAPAPVVRAVVKEARLVGVAARAARPLPLEDPVVVTAPTQAALVGTRAAIMAMEALVETKEARLATRHCPALGTTGFPEDTQLDLMTEEITVKALAVLMALPVRLDPMALVVHLARLDLLARQCQPLVATRSSPAAARWDLLATVDATQSRVSHSIACIS